MGWAGPKNARPLPTREGIDEAYLRDLYVRGAIDVWVFEEAIGMWFAGARFHHEPFHGDFVVTHAGVRARPGGKLVRPTAQLESILG